MSRTKTKNRTFDKIISTTVDFIARSADGLMVLGCFLIVICALFLGTAFRDRANGRQALSGLGIVAGIFIFALGRNAQNQKNAKSPQNSEGKLGGNSKMIEAIEVHETQITKPIAVRFLRKPFDSIPVRLQDPFTTGISFGMGLICAPIVIAVFIFLGLGLISVIF